MTAYWVLTIRLISMSVFRRWDGSCCGRLRLNFLSLAYGLLRKVAGEAMFLMTWKLSESSVHYSLVFLVISEAIIAIRYFFALLGQITRLWTCSLIILAIPQSIIFFFFFFSQNYKKWELESKLRAQRLAYCSKYLSTQTCFMFPTSEWLRLSSVCYALILTLVVMESTWIISF